jgi:hypothetical protein
MRKLYFCPFVAISLMLASGALLAQVSTSTKVLSFVGATRFNPGKPADVPINQVVQGPDVDVSFDIPGISGNNSPARLPANFVPRPAGNSFGSATFNGFMQKVEGNVTFHTAYSTAFVQPAPGKADSPGPMKVPAEQLRSLLGIADVNYVQGKHALAIVDSNLG